MSCSRAMQPISHVDVAEEERIEAILAADENHSWPAVDCEALDGWVPDLGLTSYANYSIYRPPAVAAAGITTTVGHRFRVPFKNPQLPGTYYLGALIYDQVGEDFSLEVSLGSEDVGRVEPARHDNRRHLIVIDRPIVFDNRVKWVQFASSGGGACRIERFVLLEKLPEPSSFAPTIDRLSVEVAGRDDRVTATVHCLTYPPSHLAATATGTAADDEGEVRSAEDGPSTLHALAIPDLEPDRSYTIRLVATEQDGETGQAECEVSTARSVLPGSSAVTANVELCSRVGSLPLAGMPLTFGVPVRRGALYQEPTAALVWDDGAVAAQARVHSRWPDGSARWALIDATVPAAMPAGGVLPCRVQLDHEEQDGAAGLDGGGGRLDAEVRGGAVSVAGDQLRLTVDPRGGDWLLLEQCRGGAGDWETKIAGGPLAEAFRTKLADGTLLDAEGSAAITEHGGRLHVTLRFTVSYRDGAGIPRLRSELRLHVYAGQPLVKVEHRLLVLRADPSAGPRFEPGEQEESTLLRVRSCVLHVPWAGVNGVELAGEGRQHGRFEVEEGQAWALRHEHDQAYEIVTAEAPRRPRGRVPGHVMFRSSAGASLAVGVRQFWQSYPKGIAADAGSIELQILPPLSGEEPPGDEEAWQRLYRWLQEGSYVLREGMALTTELLLGLPTEPAAAAPLFQWLESPVVARPEPAYANATGALPWLASKRGSRQPRYERLADEALRLLEEDREKWRAYGHVNFGDWYGEGDWSWGNNEYDTPYCAYWEFLRGGDPGWATWGAEAARHLTDVDTVNSFHDPRHVGLQPLHMPAHLGGYLPAYFRSKVPGTRGVPSHMWAEGPLLHYLLTGDDGVRDSLGHSAGWLLQPERLDHYEFAAVREAGWHLIHLSMLAAALNDRRAYNGAAIVVRRILEKQDEGGAWTRMLTSGHCWCGFPHCRGNVAFMVTVMLSALKRYYDLTGENAVADAILAGGRWLVRETFNDETGFFIGGSCTTMQRVAEGDVFSNQIIIEGLADAFAVSGDEEIGRCLKRVLPAVDELPDIEGHRDLGKRLSSQMRYVPTVLAALE